MPKGVLFLGKCGGLKQVDSEIGHFILPIAAIRGEGTSDEYLPRRGALRCLPSSSTSSFPRRSSSAGHDYRTGVVYTTNRRLWEHDTEVPRASPAASMTCIGIDMETATIFIVGHYNEISRGALLLVSDVPITPDGVKTEESDAAVTRDWAKRHLQIGVDAMTEIDHKGEQIRHFRY